jgi:hypothetical protein
MSKWETRLFEGVRYVLKVIVAEQSYDLEFGLIVWAQDLVNTYQAQYYIMLLVTWYNVVAE